MSEEITSGVILRHSDDKLAIQPTDRLILRAAPNGGWIIATHGGYLGVAEDVIGAYSNADEMIDALRIALVDQLGEKSKN
ncbi:MAG: hypothetical protein EP336_09335 [Rhodobacteraceae bacterium]|nr:MAG: hypothetical protein EP336_09335 [Paracoccaceae bacterium]